MKIHKLLFAFFLVISSISYVCLAYFIERSDFVAQLGLYSVSFMAYFLFVSKTESNWAKILWAGIVFRIIFLFSVPALSDDFYRFVWDAKLVASGNNPYQFTPAEWDTADEGEELLLSEMNSPHYYSVYPPLQQLFFYPSAWSNEINDSVFILHCIVLAGELLLLFLLYKSIRKKYISMAMAGWLWLNPLWIIEVSGNLHFEGWMLTFLFAGIYFLFQKKYLLSGIFLGLSAAVKLIPVLVVPFLKKAMGFKKSLVPVLLSGIVFIFCMMYLFISGCFSNFQQSIDLYFHKFEFNASVYYFLGYSGSYFTDAHPIVYSGYILMPLFAWFYIYRYFKNEEISTNKFFLSSFYILLFYYLIATTVHPWYVLPVLLFSVLARKTTGIIWSFLAYLSYTAYSGNEALYTGMLITEYMLLFGWIIFEWKNKIIFLQGNEAD
jgi:alpha-1,6-mannosyltransferase